VSGDVLGHPGTTTKVLPLEIFFHVLERERAMAFG